MGNSIDIRMQCRMGFSEQRSGQTKGKVKQTWTCRKVKRSIRIGIGIGIG